jgi:hypothetical protein
MERRRPLRDVIAAALAPGNGGARGDKFYLLTKSSKGAAMPGRLAAPPTPVNRIV